MILSLDTTLDIGSFCIIKENKVLYMESYLKPKDHASTLPLEIKKTFEELDITFKDLKKIIACVGPGSFTGIKIGLAFVKGIKSALNIETIGVSTLRAYAYPYFLYTPTLVLLKAPKKGVYGACFYNSLELLRENFYKYEEIEKFLEKNKGLTLVGNSPFIKDFEEKYSVEFVDNIEKPLALNAYYISKLYALPLKPNYLKDADINLKGIERLKKEFGINLE